MKYNSISTPARQAAGNSAKVLVKNKRREQDNYSVSANINYVNSFLFYLHIFLSYRIKNGIKMGRNRTAEAEIFSLSAGLLIPFIIRRLQENSLRLYHKLYQGF